LRFVPRSILKWRRELSRVKDERLKPAALTDLHAAGRSIVDVGGKNMEGRHVGLDFYDLLIEV
jgi:hypothetical protein